MKTPTSEISSKPISKNADQNTIQKQAAPDPENRNTNRTNAKENPKTQQKLILSSSF